MKSFISLLLATVIAGLVIFYSTSEKPELIYTLSDPILLSDEKDSKVGIQQLEVKNIGGASAKAIKVLMDKMVISFEIVKYSKADEVKSFHSKESLEINYQELPPQGIFKLVTKSTGIAKGALSINHASGRAKDATEMRQWALSDIFFIGGIIALWLVTLLSFRSTALDSWESRPKYQYEDILKGKKPFYMNVRKWESLRNESIENLVEAEPRQGGLWSWKIDNSKIYKFLSTPKPEYLNGEEWDHLLKKSREAFETNMSSIATSSYDSKGLVFFFKMEKPVHFPHEGWVNLRKKFHDSYVTMKKTELDIFPFTSSPEKMANEVNSSKPEGMEDEYWDKYIAFCKRHYYSRLSVDSELAEDPIKFLESQDLSVFQTKQREQLLGKAYQHQIGKFGDLYDLTDAKRFIGTGRPAWIKDKDYDRLKSIAQTTLNFKTQERKNDLLLTMLNSLLNFIPVGEKKPDLFSDEEWKPIMQMEYELRTRKNEIEKNEVQLRKEKEETQGLRNKIEKQLEIIHLFINDPSVLDRIEEYSNAFAPGNFANLQKLGNLLFDQKRRQG